MISFPQVLLSSEVSLLLVGRDLVKLGWESVDGIWEMKGSREWEKGSLGGSD